MTPCYYCEADDDACKTCIHSDTYIDPQEEITKLRETIQAQAAVIEKLREALIHCDKVFKSLSERGQYPKELLPSEREFLGHQGFMFMTDALSIPTDSTQILDEVQRAERERVAQMILNGRFLHDESPAALFAKEVAAAIREME